MLFQPSKRRGHPILVLEFNPYQILAVKIRRPPQGPALLEAAGEFDRADTAGLGNWLEENLDEKSRTTVICGLVPRQGFVLRTDLQGRRLEDPEYLVDLAQEQQKGQFLSATPFKIRSADAWSLKAVSALNGTVIPPEGGTCSGLICGIANPDMRQVQQSLLEHGVTPDRIEAGLLPLFGAVYHNLERRGDSRAVVIIVIHQSATSVYILGKKGVHTPNPVLHGFDSVVQLARQQLGTNDDDEVRTQLKNADRAVLSQAAKLVWRIGRDLAPVVDSFEMATGQPADEILCAALPPDLAWIAEPVARVAGRVPFAFDCDAWLPTVGLAVAEGGPKFGPQWFGPLSLVANLPELAQGKSKRRGQDALFDRPWHIDCGASDQITDRKQAQRRFLAGVTAALVMLFVAAAASWQLYAIRGLRRDTAYWESQMASHRVLFDELTSANTALKAQSTILDRAYDLMGQPYQLSEFIISLGRTIPARFRVDRIDTNETRVAISGLVMEPAEQASRTLGQYMDELRRNSAIGPLFSSIGITSLRRKTDADAVTFEITLRLNRLAP